MLRRQFLKSATAALPLLSVAGKLYALPASAGPRLLVVFLRGAYDAANIIIPVSSDFYYSARPNLAVPRGAALPLEADWGLHPALKDSIYPLWQQKQIAFDAVDFREFLGGCVLGEIRRTDHGGFNRQVQRRAELLTGRERLPGHAVPLSALLFEND